MGIPGRPGKKNWYTKMGKPRQNWDIKIGKHQNCKNQGRTVTPKWGNQPKKAPYNLTFVGMGMGNFKAQLGILSCKPQKLATPKTKVWDCQNQTQGIQSCRPQTRGTPKAKNWEFQKTKKNRDFRAAKAKNWELQEPKTGNCETKTPVNSE